MSKTSKMIEDPGILIESGHDSLVLATKLVMPHVSNELVSRPRLLERLDQKNTLLSLICAPAGFGKTTLLTNWLCQTGLPIAWVSLDDEDNDPVRFILYFIASIQTVVPEFGNRIAQALMSSNSPRLITLLSSLINEINRFTLDFVFALDDYHLIVNEDIHELVTFIIQNQPQQMHIAITSRSEPPLSLPRLRVRRQVTEVTEKDLRFNDSEATAFLNQISGLGLDKDEVSILEARTEGWIAGLQLAALSLKDEEDRQGFIRAFAGDDRYITDYLTEEVLQRLPTEHRQFLLQISILDRLCGPLCDKVTGRQDSASLLDQFEQSNLFLIPIDNKRFWYRYHHLFVELLLNQLDIFEDNEVRQLHRRASEWYEKNGLIREAMHHALKANEYEMAAGILECHGKSLFDQGQFVTLMNWYQQIPETYIKNNPRRIIQYAWIIFVSTGEVPEPYLTSVEQILDRKGVSDLSLVELKHVQAEHAFLRGFQALQNRQLASAIELVELALRLFDEIGFTEINAPLFHLATACYATGQLKKSIDLYASVVEEAFATQYLIILNGAICGLGRARYKQGQINKAQQGLQQGLERLRENGWEDLLVDVTWIYIALGELAREKNDLSVAQDLFEKAITLAKNDPCPWETLTAMSYAGLASVYQAKGEEESVQECLQHISTLNIKPALLPLFPSVEALVAKLRLRLGDITDAQHWVCDAGLNEDDQPSSDREDEYIIYARLLLQKKKTDQALKLLSHLLLLAEQQGRISVVIEVLVLQALCRQMQGSNKQAIDCLHRALELAAPEGYVRMFLDEGAALAALLRRITESGSSQAEYARQLLEQYSASEGCVVSVNTVTSSIEPLSKKELQTLELLVAGLANKEIAERLFVSQNTVKSHIKKIYAKLNVNNRVTAIKRANDLNLIG